MSAWTKEKRRKLLQSLERYKESYPYAARLEHYKSAARKYLKVNKVAKGSSDKHPCELVLMHADEAIGAAQRGDFDHFAHNFERVIRESINSNLPAFVDKAKAAGVSQSQSERAQNPRKPRLRTRAVLVALNQGCKTAHEVEAFLNNNTEISDTWGELGIETKDSQFLITAWSRNGNGTSQTTKLRLSDIPTVLTAAKKRLLFD